jgi:hypothetical protein
MGVNSVTRVSGPPRHAGLSRIIRTPDEASREKLRGVVPNGRESAEVLQLFDDSFDCLRASLRQVRVKARRTGARFGLQRHTVAWRGGLNEVISDYEGQQREQDCRSKYSRTLRPGADVALSAEGIRRHNHLT